MHNTLVLKNNHQYANATGINHRKSSWYREQRACATRWLLVVSRNRNGGAVGDLMIGLLLGSDAGQVRDWAERL